MVKAKRRQNLRMPGFERARNVILKNSRYRLAHFWITNIIITVFDAILFCCLSNLLAVIISIITSVGLADFPLILLKLRAIVTGSRINHVTVIKLLSKYNGWTIINWAKYYYLFLYISKDRKFQVLSKNIFISKNICSFML